MKLKADTLEKSAPLARQAEKPAKNEASLFNLYLPADERSRIDALLKRGRSLKVSYSSVAFILREGAKLYVRQQQIMLDKAEAGELHAKKRKHLK